MRPATPLAGERVTVLGGGLAGIAAALEAADLGASVTLLERTNRLGGMTWSFQRNGLNMDNGQHVFLGCCSEYQRFLRRIGSDRDVVGPMPLDVPVVSESPRAEAGFAHSPTVSRLRRRDLPVPFHLAGSLLGYSHISIPARLALGRGLAAIAALRADDPGLDAINFGDWLSAHGQSSEAIEAVWDLITVPTVNLPCTETSLAVAVQVFKTGLLAGRSSCDIGWSNVPLGVLHGERSQKALEAAGVRTHFATRVRHLARREHEEGWSVETDRGAFDADAVVVCVPNDEAASLVPESAAPQRRRWSELGFSAVIDVHLVFDRTITEWPVMAALHSPVQWVFDRSVASGLRAEGDTRAATSADSTVTRRPRTLGPDANGAQYLAVSLSAADRLLGEKPERIVELISGALRRLLPDAREAILVDSVVTKERRATFRASPGSRTMRARTATNDSSLTLGGAWTDTGWPATMEGAVRSGFAAARALVGCLPTPPLLSARTRPTEIESAPGELAPIGTAQIETAQIETAQIETAQIKTAQIETAQIETAHIDTTREVA